MADHSFKSAEKAPAEQAAAPAPSVRSQPRSNEAAVERLDLPDSPALADKFDLLDGQLGDILESRAKAIVRLGETMEEIDSPPAWQPIALAVGLIALSAATAGIATVVAGAVAGSAVLAGSSAATAMVVTEMVQVTTDQGLNTSINAVLASPSSEANPKQQFFYAQEDAVDALKHEGRESLIHDVRKQTRTSEDPLAMTTALVAAFKAGQKVAQERQREATLASWCNFLARADLGVHNGGRHKPGADLEWQVGDTSARGVLGVRVALSDGADRLEIVDAEIEGLNETSRGELAARPIGELGVSVTVQGEGLRIGENEGGRRWNESTAASTRWLADRAAGEQIPDETWGSLGALPRLDLIDEGIERSLEDDIKPNSLTGLGVVLDG